MEREVMGDYLPTQKYMASTDFEARGCGANTPTPNTPTPTTPTPSTPTPTTSTPNTRTPVPWWRQWKRSS